MGQVYRARDTSWNRDVAIKVRPTSVAGDSKRASDDSIGERHVRRAIAEYVSISAGRAITRGLRAN
jgi:hypothetical protein